MKKISILTILLSSFLFSVSLSPTEITNMISKIKEERVGISLSKLEGTLNPFLLNPKTKSVKKETKKKSTTVVAVEVNYVLTALLNHSAFINKKWYKTGDKLGNYKVGYISSNSVRLKSEFGNKVLTLEKKKKKFIKIKEGYKRW